MITEYAMMYLVFRTGWAVLGVLLGTYAIINVKSRWQGQSLSVKARWWAQVILIIPSAGFALWITMAFQGSVWPIGWAALTALIVGSFLAPMNAFWLLVESSSTTKQVASAA